MAKIRVDQSHCNYHLAQFLLESGWAVIFTDAGRVSRGGGGDQGASLRIFESLSLPIPDIVAYKDGIVMIIEIDKQFDKALESIECYKANRELLSFKFKEILNLEKPPDLRVGFCRTGVFLGLPSAIPQTSDGESIDMYCYFSAPRSPRLLGTPALTRKN